MSSFVRLLLDGIIYSQCFDKHNKSAFTYVFEDETDKTVRIGVPIFALRSLFASSAPAMIIESKTIGCTNKALPAILLEHSPTFQFTRSLVMISDNALSLKSPESKMKLANLQKLVFNCNLSTPQMFDLMLVCCLRLETLQLSSMSNEIMKEVLLDEQIQFPSLDHLSFSRDGRDLENELLCSVVKKLGRHLETFTLNCRGLTYGARLASAPTFDLDDVLESLAHSQQESTSRVKLEKITINAFKHRVHKKAFEILTDKCPMLNSLDLNCKLMEKTTVSKDDDTIINDSALDGLFSHRHHELSFLREIKLEQNSPDEFLLSEKFCHYIIPNLTKLSIYGSKDQQAFSLPLIYGNATNLETLELYQCRDINVTTICFEHLGLAKNLRNLVVRPLNGNLDREIPLLFGLGEKQQNNTIDEENTSSIALSGSINSENDDDTVAPFVPPGRFLTSLHISGVSTDTDASWLPLLFPKLEELTLHVFGYKQNLHKNIADALSSTLKRLTVATESNLYPEMFEHVARCGKLEELVLDSAGDSALKKQPECLQALRKINKTLVRFDLDSCELGEKVIYDMVYGED